jgi:hypothetical protein
MSDTYQTMMDNLPEKTGRSLQEWFAVLAAAGLDKHTELQNHLKQEHGVTHGYANGIVLRYRAQGDPQSPDDLVDAQYTGAKAALRPVYEALVEAASTFGDDVQVAPKKTGVSLRRSKQFALVEAASSKRVQLGLQLKGTEPTDRLLPGTAMCSHKVSLSSVGDVDAELLRWLRAAYDRA